MADNHKKLKEVFYSVLEIKDPILVDQLQYQNIPQWDSITHMFLISEIENTFELELAGEDILDMKSFEKAKQVLIKYNITF